MQDKTRAKRLTPRAGYTTRVFIPWHFHRCPGRARDGLVATPRLPWQVPRGVQLWTGSTVGLHRRQVLNECWPSLAMVVEGIHVKNIFELVSLVLT